MPETVKLRYGSSTNISFRGVIETGIPVEDWAEMSAAEQDVIFEEAVWGLIDIWIDD